mmetsp:Transcript_14481/g.14339  ORF Transcript_14481/g.14339 Transcript_14481/m.14339 type:complete len:96 (+) Transcript_14481:188-475(+)
MSRGAVHTGDGSFGPGLVWQQSVPCPLIFSGMTKSVVDSNAAVKGLTFLVSIHDKEPNLFGKESMSQTCVLRVPRKKLCDRVESENEERNNEKRV